MKDLFTQVEKIEKEPEEKVKRVAKVAAGVDNEEDSNTKYASVKEVETLRHEIEQI